MPCVDLPDMTNPPVATREDLLNLMHLPKVELDKFGGNPLEYLTFIAVFDEVVGSTVIIVIRQPLCPVVGRRPQHVVSK